MAVTLRFLLLCALISSTLDAWPVYRSPPAGIPRIPQPKDNSDLDPSTTPLTFDDEDEVEYRISLWDGVTNLPGIDANRLIPLENEGSYPDGKDCGTGQDPFSPAEAQRVAPLLRREFEKQQKKPFAAIYVAGMYEKYRKSSPLKDHCESRQCTLHLKTMNYVCGPLPPAAYASGTSCLDGSEPLTAVKFRELGILSEQGISYRNGPSEEQVKAENKKAQRLYGQYCESGRCNYHILRGNYICDSARFRSSSLTVLLSVYILLQLLN